MTKRLENRKVLLGVTGGIAAYKAAELARLIIREGAEVKVVMTKSAAEFITPLTFRSLTGYPVLTDIFSAETDSGIDHISNTDWADIFIIAPATANIIGKLASGIGDDALSTMALAFNRMFLIAPAMNTKMYQNPIVRENIEKLKSYNFNFIGPEKGALACGHEGPGRMIDPAEIVNEAVKFLSGGDLDKKKILVTAGPTREEIDPVRFISNRSSGKMGYAIAEEASKRGAQVILVSGPTSLPHPQVSAIISTESADEMYNAVMEHLEGCDAVVMAAAVSDYAPETKARKKIKKKGETLRLELAKTKDIAGKIGRLKKRPFLVGFAAETDNLLKNAAKKLESKGLDLIVANDVTEAGAGFDVDTNRIYIMDKSGIISEPPLASKTALAREIIDLILQRIS